MKIQNSDDNIFKLVEFKMKERLKLASCFKSKKFKRATTRFKNARLKFLLAPINGNKKLV